MAWLLVFVDACSGYSLRVLWALQAVLCYTEADGVVLRSLCRYQSLS